MTLIFSYSSIFFTLHPGKQYSEREEDSICSTIQELISYMEKLWYLPY